MASWHQLLYFLREGFFEDRSTLSIVRYHVNLRFINNFLLMSDEIAWCEHTNLLTAKGTPRTVVISKSKRLCTIENDENRGCGECIQNPLPSYSRNIAKCHHRHVKMVKIQTGRNRKLFFLYYAQLF